MKVELENVDRLIRYADALSAFTRSEPLPWTDFFIQNARAQRALLLDPTNADGIAALEAVHAQAERFSMSYLLNDRPAQ